MWQAWIKFCPVTDMVLEETPDKVLHDQALGATRSSGNLIRKVLLQQGLILQPQDSKSPKQGEECQDF